MLFKDGREYSKSDRTTLENVVSHICSICIFEAWNILLNSPGYYSVIKVQREPSLLLHFLYSVNFPTSVLERDCGRVSRHKGCLVASHLCMTCAIGRWWPRKTLKSLKKAEDPTPRCGHTAPGADNWARRQVLLCSGKCEW